ncbi:hypothetical protein OYE22_24230 [Streptomyces sp. 71268]|uniref:hypothetical protein n=1 Tax=Streptomyces sp. 71268 TaxID=3002640 RepID=UPI0023F99E8D|nr:hypothetical protein [Streptomyces sp. 71268]WEV27932.1 hypothetical protein OYE22_24230 [Streptomyces sp. 71268]
MSGNTGVHWHAFAWTGHERPPDSERVIPTNPTPPLEVAHWLRKQRKHVAATFTDADAAVEWMREELAAWPMADQTLSTVESKIEFTRECLSRPDADVVFGFYPAVQRYVSRCLIYCPRPGEKCPDPPA